MSVIAPSTKEQIVLAAEELFVEHGLDGVSLRQIGAAAGNGNNSAVQYHFGSKERLVQAVFEYRLPRLRERRELLIAEHRPDDLRTWVACLVRWMLEQSELEGSNYHELRGHAEPVRAATTSFDARARRLPRGHAGGTTSSSRRSSATSSSRCGAIASRRRGCSIVHAAADRERARATGQAVLPFAVALGDLVDAMVGFLAAPVSAASREALERADPVSVSRLAAR